MGRRKIDNEYTQLTLDGRPGENEKPKKPRTIKPGALHNFVFKKLNAPCFAGSSHTNVEKIIDGLIKSAILGDTPAAKMLLNLGYLLDQNNGADQTSNQSISPIRWVEAGKPENDEDLIEEDYKALGISQNDGN
jgi:hypothetical protein